MELSLCFCIAAALGSIFTVLWSLSEGHWVGPSAAALIGISTCFMVPPGVCGGVLFILSFILLTCVTKTKVQLLPTKDRAVLVTGCDSGFGLALVKQLNGLGLTVFAGVLDVNGSGAQQLRERGSEKLQVVQLDVTDSAQIETVHHYIRTQVSDTGLWGLVNNAGVLGSPADAELQPIAVYRRCMDVNFVSAVKMSQVFLPLLRRSRGRIVNVSSLAGDIPLPTFAAYGASKAALSIFSQVMRLELSAWGVNVSVIQPTGFRTNLFGNADDVARFRDEILASISSEAREDYGTAYITSLPSSLSKMSSECAEDLSPVVDAMCHALMSPRPHSLYTPGQMGWLLPFLHRHLPAFVFDAVITSLIKHDECPAGLNKS